MKHNQACCRKPLSIDLKKKKKKKKLEFVNIVEKVNQHATQVQVGSVVSHTKPDNTIGIVNAN